MSALKDQLFEEILQARQRVYAVGEPTPLQRLNLPGVDAVVYAKREDLGPIKAYKWRGAYNCMCKLTPEQLAGGVVAASAGNHGQGVALAARRLGSKAHIFMPRSTPAVKQNAVKSHGGDNVEIVLVGDSYDAASAAAHEFAEANNLTFVHPYDDLATMGGQGTLADEVVMSGQGVFDRVYLQIGGGGLAAGCACWFTHSPGPEHAIAALMHENAKTEAKKHISRHNRNRIPEGGAQKLFVQEKITRFNRICVCFLL